MDENDASRRKRGAGSGSFSMYAPPSALDHAAKRYRPPHGREVLNGGGRQKLVPCASDRGALGVRTQMALQMREQHLDLPALASGLCVRRVVNETSGRSHGLTRSGREGLRESSYQLSLTTEM